MLGSAASHCLVFSFSLTFFSPVLCVHELVYSVVFPGQPVWKLSEQDSPCVLRFRFVLPFEDNSRKALLAGQHWIKAPLHLLWFGNTPSVFHFKLFWIGTDDQICLPVCYQMWFLLKTLQYYQVWDEAFQPSVLELTQGWGRGDTSVIDRIELHVQVLRGCFQLIKF